MNTLQIFQLEMIAACCQLVGSLNSQLPEAVFGFQCSDPFMPSLRPPRVCAFNQTEEHGVRSAYLKDKPTLFQRSPPMKLFFLFSAVTVILLFPHSPCGFVLALEPELDSRDLHCQKSPSTALFHLRLPCHLQGELCSWQVTWPRLPPPDPRCHTGFLSSSSVYPSPHLFGSGDRGPMPQVCILLFFGNFFFF